ncbi:hypothetical protein PoHVEF18_005929 [Penicillium ochrochloron]
MRPRRCGTFLNVFKLTDGAENNTRKGIAEDEFKDTGDKKQQATKEDDGSAILVA